MAANMDTLLQQADAALVEAQLDALPAATEPLTGPKRRISKACEMCRARRIKCVGGVPCDGCRSLGESDRCEVRSKARPNRTVSHKRESAAASRSRGIGRVARPIRDVEHAISIWAIQRTGEDLQLGFEDVPRLSRFQSAALLPAPLIDEYEDSLIEFLTTSKTVTHLDFINSDKLVEIYRSYRSAPGNLTDDSLALLHACFCLASFTLARTKRGRDGHLDIQPNGEDVPREDVTYFRMACDDLTKWGRPSTSALWALHGLASYAAACGGVAECRNLLKTMAWHISEMGLDKMETANLYAPQDQVDKLFFNCFYQDCLTAAICDEAPFLRWSNFDIDPTTASTIPEVSMRVTILESQALDKLYDESVDTSSPDFVLEWESKWLPFMRQLRNATSDTKVLSSWANMRFHWLWLLLRAPCLDHPTLAASSISILARCVSQILWTLSTLSESNQLNPSFPQIRRIVTCGHVLILAYEQGEFHRAEADALFRILLDLLDKHRQTWPAANGLIPAFTRAANLIGLLEGDNVAQLEQPPAADLPIWNDYIPSQPSNQ